MALASAAELYGLMEYQGRREGMEDTSAILLTDDFGLFGVFDGHGGDTCSQYCRDKVLSRVSHALQKGVAPRKALEQAFVTVDKDYCKFAEKMDLDDGSTGTVLLLMDGEYHLAATGDSRAVLVNTDGTATALSFDHKPERRDERERVKKLGGAVEYDHENDTYRVFCDEVGGLAVTRAIGDVAFKPYVTAQPEISSGTLDLSKAAYVCMASDGLWDDVTNAEAADIITELKDQGIQECVKELVYIAYSRGSEDNITVLSVSLSKWGERQDVIAEAAAAREPEPEASPQASSASSRNSGSRLSAGKKKHHHKRTIPGLDEDGNLSDLLLWKKPLRTFLWLTVGCLVFFLTYVAGYSVLTLSSYLLMMQIVITTFVVHATPIMKRLHLVRPDFDSTVFVLQGALLSDEVVRRAANITNRVATNIFDNWNVTVREASASNVLLSLRFVSYFFTPLPLEIALFILFLGMFSLPATYHHNSLWLDKRHKAALAAYHRASRAIAKPFK